MLRVPPAKRFEQVAEVVRTNANALQLAVQYCADHGIGCFRVNSQILPLRTHPEVGYSVSCLPRSDEIVAAFRACGALAAQNQIRLMFHPDQFVVLSSPHANVITSSLAELEYHAEVADWIGADVITIHGGGAYGNKSTALERLRSNLGRLSSAARSRIALENDDRVFSPQDLLPFCELEQVPFVYDIHHHRCLSDELLPSEATARALRTWSREPLFHVSSPEQGWRSPNPRVHHEFISVRDFPVEWCDLAITVEVEARAKEIAVRRLQRLLAEPANAKKPQLQSRVTSRGANVAALCWR